MKNTDQVVVDTLKVITENPGISINGVMQKIGTAHGGPGTYKDAKVFSGVQFLKASKDIKQDDRVKKNVPLYAKGVKLPKEPITGVTFRKPKEQAAEVPSTEPANA